MGCGIVIEFLESRRLLAGVTLITHGFNGSADGWVTTMGNAIARFGDELERVLNFRDNPAVQLAWQGSRTPVM